MIQCPLERLHLLIEGWKQVSTDCSVGITDRRFNCVPSLLNTRQRLAILFQPLLSVTMQILVQLIDSLLMVALLIDRLDRLILLVTQQPILLANSCRCPSRIIPQL